MDGTDTRMPYKRAQGQNLARDPDQRLYSKITKLRKRACEIPAANHRVIRECQQVVPLPLIDEIPQPYGHSLSDDRSEQSVPEVILKAGSYCIEYPTMQPETRS